MSGTGDLFETKGSKSRGRGLGNEPGDRSERGIQGIATDRSGEVEDRPRSDPAKLSALLAWPPGHANGLSTGQAADLRRMDAEAPGRAAAALYGALEAAGLSSRPSGRNAVEDARRWGTLVQIVALLSGTGRARAHDPTRDAGRVIRVADYSEARMMRLMASRGPGLRRGTVRLARFLAAKRAGPLDLRPLFELVLNEGRNERKAEEARLGLAAGYYLARQEGTEASQNERRDDE